MFSLRICTDCSACAPVVAFALLSAGRLQPHSFCSARLWVNSLPGGDGDCAVAEAACCEAGMVVGAGCLENHQQASRGRRVTALLALYRYTINKPRLAEQRPWAACACLEGAGAMGDELFTVSSSLLNCATAARCSSCWQQHSINTHVPVPGANSRLGCIQR